LFPYRTNSMEIVLWYDKISDKMQNSQLTQNRPLTFKYVFVIYLPTQHIVYCLRSAHEITSKSLLLLMLWHILLFPIVSKLHLSLRLHFKRVREVEQICY